MEDRPIVLPPLLQEQRDDQSSSSSSSTAASNSALMELLDKYPLSKKENGDFVKFDYGTAGFRYKATEMDTIFVRVGIFAAHRAAQLNKSIGVMVTASHNDESYNGVKIADPHGGMMTPDGEALAIQLVNSHTSLDVLQCMKQTTETSSSNNNSNNKNKCIVHVGRDTRSHSVPLLELTIQAARAMGATVLNHGVVTTPILHYCTMMDNPQYLPPIIPPRPNVQGYYDQMANAYMGLLMAGENYQANVADLEQSLVVDCACGVGYIHVLRLQDTLQRLGARRTLVARNAPQDGPLNVGCGSEHVQKQVLPPTWYGQAENNTSPVSYATSLDGDSDRIVFFTESPSFRLLDGDKIAALICEFLQSQFDLLENAISDSCQATQNGSSSPIALPSFGVVQTAYANGASTMRLQEIMGKDRVLIAKTGVKYVHAMAHDNFDVGVYFEANGHGTILFGEKYYDFLAAADKHVRGNVALRRLQLLPVLVNQAVGDALSDLLLVDAMLQIQGRSIQDWIQLYTELPSRQCKVKVEDRKVIKTNDNETQALAPPGLQDALDSAMTASGMVQARCFVRPSGTENVVRVYAEAMTQEQADALAIEACKLVHKFCKGIGDIPVFPPSKM